MPKGGSSAPDPDPRIGEAALLQAKTGTEWLSFAKDAFKVSTERQAELDVLTRQVTEQQLGLSKDQAGWAKADRARHETTFKPVENAFIAEAKNYASAARQEEAAATAAADVQSAAAQSRATARREAASMGVNPASGRFAGIERAGEMGTALATAGAKNTARQTVRDKGLALKADVVNLGRGLPAQSASAAALGLSAGSSAVGLNQNNQQISNAAPGIVGQGFQGQMAGYSGQANTLQNLHNSELQAWSTEQQIKSQNAAGIGSAIGGIAGLFFSDENLKEDKEQLPEGEALEAVKSMPVEEWTYKPGVADEGRHIGPYAQDFAAATGKGDGHTIAVQDAIGITMKAVQDLDAKVDKIAGAVGLGGAEPRRSPPKTVSPGVKAPSNSVKPNSGIQRQPKEKVK